VLTLALVVSLALVVYSYAGYFLVLALWDGVREGLGAIRFLAGGSDRRARTGADAWPKVSLVFAAYDEEACIRAKLENCLALDYPADRLELIVACDGCTDRTAAIAREAGGPRVEVLELSPRSGKAAAISKGVLAATGEVVVLTDANVLLEPGAIRALARRFRDPSVGAVVGRLRLYNRARADYEEGLYWRFETLLKYYEGKHGCVLGANGGIYAIRRALFSPLSPDTITDDFVVPVRIAARGFRVPFEPDAVAHEETTEDAGREFVRRARIGAGNWQALARVPEVLDPRTGFLCFAFVSHKLLRWATPLLLAVALGASAVLAAEPGAWDLRALLAAQLAFYGLAYAGRRGAAGPFRRVASLAHYFVSMNVALAVGFWRFVRGTQPATWQRTDRMAPPPPGVSAA
jgi:cellulose synthase/poly-beta-1,6-N-acetylglucosamine synthase-like glycosyltransferase